MHVFSFAQVISAGTYHALYICTDSTLISWGENGTGQIGIGTTSTPQTTPAQVHGTGNIGFLTEITAVAGGAAHSLALKNDSTVWAWGWNNNGQLGDNTTITRTSPVQVHGLGNIGFLTGIISVAGGLHSIALKNDNTVWAWGLNNSGQLGDGTNTGKITPVQVNNLTGIFAVGSGYYHSLALKNDSTIWAWGLNSRGQLGDGTNTDSNIPVQMIIPSSGGIKSVAGGLEHTVILKNDGTVWACGNNTFYGAIGVGVWGNEYWIPVQVHGPGNIGFLTGIIKIATGIAHCLALKNDGTVWAWGYNNFGQLGDGTTAHRNVPVQVSGLTGIVALAGGDTYSLALKNDGTVWAWGNNSSGQLGDSTLTDRHTPIQVNGICMLSSIDELQQADNIIIYPNPSNGKFNIKNDELQMTKYKIEIYNVLGEKIYFSLINSGKSEIDLTQQYSGIYFYRVVSENRIIMANKFVVIK